METADTEDIYYAPIDIVDLGIGGGETYGISDKQGHHGTIHMVSNTVKIRLVYEETEIYETLHFIKANFRYLTINGDVYLNEGCKIIIEHYNK